MSITSDVLRFLSALSFCVVSGAFAQLPPYPTGGTALTSQLNAMWAASVPITGGDFTGPVSVSTLTVTGLSTLNGLTAPLPIADGGTGAVTPAGAAANLAVMPLAGGTFSGPVAFSLRPTFNGATPWDSANFDPSIYMPRGGGTFTGPVAFTIRPTFNGATPWDSLNFDPNNYALLNGPSFIGSVSFATRPIFNGATPWDSLNLDPSIYMPKSGGAFTGLVTFSSRPSFNGATPWDSANFTPQAPILSGTTVSFGGDVLIIGGSCVSQTVTITGVASGMAVVATPTVSPGDGLFWYGYVSSANTVIVKLCAVVSVLPTSTTYNVRVFS